MSNSEIAKNVGWGIVALIGGAGLVLLLGYATTALVPNDYVVGRLTRLFPNAGLDSLDLYSIGGAFLVGATTLLFLALFAVVAAFVYFILTMLGEELRGRKSNGAR